MLRTAVRHLTVLALVFAAYKAGRGLASADLEPARERGERLWAIERALRLPNEADVQQLVLRSDDLVRVVNGYYAQVHFPFALGVLVWLAWRRYEHFLWAAWSLGLSMAGALVLHLAAPTAPPRLLGHDGIVDTGTLFGQSPYGDPAVVGYDGQLLALPSLHAGWSLLLVVVLVSAHRGRARWLWLLHPVLTVLVIVATGNHYWLDAVLGWAVCLVALRASQRWTLDRAPAFVPHALVSCPVARRDPEPLAA